jgi:hypothetical protein
MASIHGGKSILRQFGELIPLVALFSRVEANMTSKLQTRRYLTSALLKGMNAGKDVFTLMQEIKLPANGEARSEGARFLRVVSHFEQARSLRPICLRS